MLAQQVADACALPMSPARGALRVGRSQIVLDDDRRVVLDASSRFESADHVVGLLARGPRLGCAETQALVETADLSISGRLRNVPAEATRFQTLDFVSRAASRGQPGSERPPASTVGTESRRERDRRRSVVRRPRGGPAGTSQSSSGNATRSAVRRSSAALRARESPGDDVRCTTSSLATVEHGRETVVRVLVDDEHRKDGWVWASSESRRRSSSATRPIVATTRSNDGSSGVHAP